LPKTVLLADDSVTAQNMGRRILTDAGYEVITVNNGSAALKKIHESRPDLIVLDVYMPGYGGLEVCQRLKESGETMRIPVLLTVGKMEPFKTDEAKRVRADGHIIKPFDASELLAALTKLEDRIVPEAEAPKSGKSKKEKKSRFWNMERSEPVKEEDPSGEISRLAELKRREREQPASEPEAEARDFTPPKPQIEETTPKKVVEEIPVAKAEESMPADDSAPATFASANVPEAPPEAAGEVKAAEEFAVATPQYEEPESETPAAAVEESTPKVEAAAESLAPAGEEASTPAKPRWVAENVALSAEEAALALDQEMQQAQASSLSAVTEVAMADAAVTPEMPALSSSKSKTEKSGAAFAAAAASSSSEAVSSTSLSPATADPEAEPPVTSDAAAAWKNWEQIRERVIGTQTEAIAESVAEAARASLPATSELSAISESPAAESAAAKTESTSAPQLEGEALASIVDTVLAELKPKLMAEIAKKLSTEKK
jgi:CheY-like chemotaxis protein